MKKVIVLGASGSIGLSTAKVARRLPDEMKLVGLAVQKSTGALLEQAREFGVKSLAVYDEVAASGIEGQLPEGSRLFKGRQGLVDLVRETEADMVLVAIVGTAGLEPALAALETGKELAVASKEILVMAGEAVMNLADEKKLAVLPVDSEHNAIFQCLLDAPEKEVSRLILTASGGPFRKSTVEEITQVTLEQALKHPTWDMGRKITIDSATMFNKGLEMIEARWLFGVDMGRIDVIVHPQSIVHSMVEFVDHSVLAQFSHTDMCFPIQYAVTYPARMPTGLPKLDFAQLGQILFEAPDPIRFPALRLAREAGMAGGTLPAVMNAANEVAVECFINRKCSFPTIWETVEKVMLVHENIASPDLDAILQADSWSRKEAAQHLSL